MQLCQPLARSAQLRPARWCADRPTDQPCGVAGQERIFAQMQEGDASKTPEEPALFTGLGPGV